jgi:glycerol-3-phosphate dehydrogenase (NAD(P)+)
MLTQNEDFVGWWVRREEVALHIRQYHHNPNYLSEVELETDKIYVDHDLLSVAAQAEILVLAVPSAFLAEAIEPLRDVLAQKWVVSAVKGIVAPNHWRVPSRPHGLGLQPVRRARGALPRRRNRP